MATWIALIRGIDAGGEHMVPMKTLAADLTAAGCADVKTYLQSGRTSCWASRRPRAIGGR